MRTSFLRDREGPTGQSTSRSGDQEKTTLLIYGIAKPTDEPLEDLSAVRGERFRVSGGSAISFSADFLDLDFAGKQVLFCVVYKKRGVYIISFE